MANEMSAIATGELNATTSPLDEYLAMVVDARWLILGLAAAVLLAAGAYIGLSTPVYRPDALLQVTTPFSLPEVMRGEGTETVADDSPLIDEKTVVASRAVLGRVVDRLGLEISAVPRYLPLMGEALARGHDERLGLAQPRWGFRHYAWGGEQIELATLELPDRLRDPPLTLIAEEGEGYRLLDPNGALLLVGRVGVLAEGKAGPEQSLKVLVTKLVARPGTHFQVTKRAHRSVVGALQGALTADTTGKRSSILKLSLEGPDPAETARILNAIAKEYARQNVAQQSLKATQTLHFLEDQLPELKRRLEAAEAALHAFRQQHNSVDLSSEARSLIEQTAKAEAELTALKQTREELRRRFKPRHPQMMSLDRQLTGMAELLGELDARRRALPETERTYMRLAREVEVATALYTSLLNSAQQQRVAMASTLANVRILDPAFPVQAPVWPRPTLVMALATLLGGFLSLGIVFTRNALNHRIADPKTLEALFRLPVYAVIPHSKRQDRLQRVAARKPRHALLAIHQPADQSLESLRALRVSFLPTRSANSPSFLPAQARSAAVMVVTSAAPGAGKSFVSANFGALLASTGERVLLIDADLRKGQLHVAVGAVHEPGITSLLVSDLDRLIHTTSVPGLDLLPCGGGMTGSVDRLLGECLGEALGRLRQRYDHIIIDTPPVLSVADAVIVGRHATAAVLVVRAGQATPRELEYCLLRLRRAGIEPKGLLLNDVDPNSRQYGYAYAVSG
ncbi:MAG: GNVR domain-containing protein [Gammaproteobacteria bacterium]